MYHYQTRGTCSTAIDIELDGDVVKRVTFQGGCDGNTQGVARLAAGRKIDDVIELLGDVTCKGGSSCPAQLARALEQYKEGR